MNTREYRTRKRLEEDRHEKIQALMKLNEGYKPPADYKPPIVRVNDKVMIPQDDHPEINFVGLLIGPRGNTLKTLEKDTGAKIIIRGKGSVKEGKIGRKDGQPLPGEDEPLHAYITANDPENVKKAVTRIHEIIKEGIEIPEEKNDLRKQQLRELALLNGTLRDNDAGLMKLRQIAEAETIITNQIICTKCGSAGHIAKDCVQRPPAEITQQQMVSGVGLRDLPANTIVGRQDRAKMDSEYMSLMAELGQVAPETVKADLASKMPQPLMDQNPGKTHGGGGGGGGYSQGGDDTAPPLTGANSTPQLSADYGYGGRRSRFEDFDNNRGGRGGRHDSFRAGNRFGDRDGGGGRFDQGPRFDGGNRRGFDSGPPSRFDHGPPGSRYDHGAPPSRFDQGPPPTRFDQGPHASSRFDQGPPPSRFDQGPPRFDHGPPPGRFDRGPPPPFEQQGGWNQGPPGPSPQGNMMNSNRWGPPGSSLPPPPPSMPPGPPMGGGYVAPPPPPPSTSSGNSWSNNAPWQQSSAPAPPWQQSSFGGGSNPAAPPPPPPPSSSSGYGGYSSAPLPPPPPPQ